VRELHPHWHHVATRQLSACADERRRKELNLMPVQMSADADIVESYPDLLAVHVFRARVLWEGAAIYEFKHSDRIVVGTHNDRAKAILAESYRPLSESSSHSLHA
jgi:hypothetical protein